METRVRNGCGNAIIKERQERIIALIDVYTFATQVLARKLGNKNWNTGPSITVLNTGRIISANKHAKDIGISNTIKLNQACNLVAERGINMNTFVQPSYETGKPDQTLFREAGHQVLEVIMNYIKVWKYQPIIEWIPQDETYLDITDQVNYFIESGQTVKDVGTKNCILAFMSVAEYAPDWPLHKFGPNIQNKVKNLEYSGKIDDLRKSISIKLMNGLMEKIHNVSLLHCSGGIGPNKMLAKIACSLFPPGTLNFLSNDAILLKKNSASVLLKKLTTLDSNIKEILHSEDIETMWDLQNVSSNKLMSFGFSKADSNFIKQVSFGIDDRMVQMKLHIRSINSGRKYYRPISNYSKIKFELSFLMMEFNVRLKEQLRWYNRYPEYIQLVVNYTQYRRGQKYTQTIPLTKENLFCSINHIVKKMWGINNGVTGLQLSGLRVG